MRVSKIISGGQTGADQGGIEAGRQLSLDTGGWAPNGWRTEVGACPRLAEFGLHEHPSSNYPPRTEMNVKTSDGTVLFGNASSPGSRLTIRLCRLHNKPWIHIPFINSDGSERLRFLQWLSANTITVLNVAGNRESKHVGIQAKVREFLITILPLQN